MTQAAAAITTIEPIRELPPEATKEVREELMRDILALQDKAKKYGVWPLIERRSSGTIIQLVPFDKDK